MRPAITFLNIQLSNSRFENYIMLSLFSSTIPAKNQMQPCKNSKMWYNFC